MIKISRQADYALQLILELSALEHKQLLSLKIFSLKSSISFLFLQKIAKKLREAGLIEAGYGKNGGYKLKKSADEITLKNVIETIDGPYGTTDCARAGGYCQKADKCHVKHGLNQVNNQIIKYFENVKVIDLIVEKPKQNV